MEPFFNVMGRFSMQHRFDLTQSPLSGFRGRHFEILDRCAKYRSNEALICGEVRDVEI